MIMLRDKFKAKEVVIQETVPLVSLPTAGELLRRARKEQGRELESFCREMGMSRSTLEKLENDQYALLPIGPYVRGYLKNYCAALGIDAKAVLESYYLLSGENQQEEVSPARQSAESRARKGRLRGASVLVAVLLAMLLLWLAQPGIQRENAVPELVDSTQSPLSSAKK